MSSVRDTKDDIIHEVTVIEDGDTIKSINSSSTDNDKKKAKLKWYQKADWFHTVKYRTEEEKRYVRKLDLFLITWANIAYLIKSIDQGNVANAYVSGMKEDLNFQGTDYNRLDSFFRIGYSIFLIPSQVILQKINPAVWLSSCELTWGILTGLCAVASKPSHLYPLRFFMGMFESSSWPGIVNILFNYYTRDELISRLALFQISSYAASMFSGFMQAAIYKTLNGKSGVSGWRWMFIINGLMTVVVAVSGYVIVPDSPADGGAKYWMNARDREIAIERSERSGIKTKRGMTFKDFYTAFLDWRIYLFLFAFLGKGFCSAPNYFNLWLKSLVNEDGTKTYSVTQLNTIPVGGNALQIFSILFYGFLSQVTGYTLPFILIQDTLILFGNIVLSVWPKSRAFKFSVFYIIHFGECTMPLLLTYLSEVYADSPQKRSIATGICVVCVYANIAWLQLFLWPADQAPHYKYGYKFSCFFIFMTMSGASLFCYYVYLPALKKNKENERKRALEEGRVDSEELSDLDEVQPVVSKKTDRAFDANEKADKDIVATDNDKRDKLIF